MTNIVDGIVEPPAPGDVSLLPEPGTPEHARHEATLQKKLGYLQPTFFFFRAGIY